MPGYHHSTQWKVTNNKNRTVDPRNKNKNTVIKVRATNVVECLSTLSKSLNSYLK
jgi:hypothetical protein